MSLVGSAEVRVALNRAQLDRDVAQAENIIRRLDNRQAIVGLNATSARQALEDISKRADRLANQISRAQAVGVDTRAARQQLEQLAQLSDRIGARIRQREALNINSSQARQALGDVRQEADRLSSRIRQANRVTVDTSAASRAFQGLVSEAQNTSRRIQQGLISGLLGVESFENVGRGIGQNIGQGIKQGITSILSSIIQITTQAIGSSLQASRGFSGAIRSFAALSNEEVDSVAVKEVRQEVEKLAIATTKTPQQIASAAIELTKLGFSAKETKKELGGLVQLSEATGSAIEKSASIVGAASNVYQRSAKDIADIVAATANATAADANDFLQAVSKAGGVAKSNNQDLETLATAFGLIRNAGFEAEAAATAVKTAINRLSAPTTKPAQDAMAQLGVQIRDSTTKEMRNLIELVPEFRSALQKFDPGTRAKLVKTIFGDEGGPAFLALLATTQEKIDSTYATIRNSSGRAAETSAKLIRGLDGELKRFEGSVSLLQVKFGDALSPAAEGATIFANKVLNGLLETEGLFGSVQSAAQAFGDELANNSELAERVQSAFELAIQELSEQGISILQEFTNTLRENPKLLADMVAGTAELVKGLAQAVKFATDIASALSAGKRELDILYSVGGTEGEGARQSIRGMGGTQDEVTAFDNELKKRLTAANLPVEDFGIIGPAREKYDNIVSDTAAQFQDRITARNRQKLKEKEAAAAVKPESETTPAAKAVKTPPKYVQINNGSKEQAQAFKDEALATSQAKSAIEGREQSAITSAKQSLLKGDIDPEQAQAKIAQAQKKANLEEIAAETQHLKRIEDLKAKGAIDSQKYGEEEVKTSARIRTLKGQILDAEIKEREDKNRRILENLERSNRQAEAAIANSATNRITTVKQELLRQEITEEQAAERIAKIRQETASADVELVKKQLADVDRLEKTKVLTAKQAADKRLELESQLAVKNQELVDQEIEGQQRIRDEAIKGIEDRIAAEKRRSDQAIANLDLEQKRLVELAQKSDEITKNLVESRGSLDTAKSNADTNSAQISIDRTNRALELRKQIDQKDIDPGLKNNLEKELGRLGFSSSDTELDILVKRQNEEDKLAKIKLSALEQEQKLKRALEELDIRRLQFAQKQAEYEAKKGVFTAKQAENEAKGALAKAEQMTPGRERDKAIADAKDQISNAAEGVKLAEENVALTKEQGTALKEILENKRKALEIDQQSARVDFNAKEEARKSGQRQEAAEALTRNPGGTIAYRDSDGYRANSPEAQQPKEYSSDPVQRANELYPGREQPLSAYGQRTNSLRDQLELQPDKTFLEKYLTPASPKTSDILEQGKGGMLQTPIASSIFDSAPIVAEIQKLNANITSLAARPTTLQVSTPEPVADAAKIYSDVSKNAVRAANI